VMLKSRQWKGSNGAFWRLSQRPISTERIKERKSNPHAHMTDLEYIIEVKYSMCDEYRNVFDTISITESELIDLIVNAELILKRRSLPQ